MVTQRPTAETERGDAGVKRTGGSVAELRELGLAEAATMPDSFRAAVRSVTRTASIVCKFSSP